MRKIILFIGSVALFSNCSCDTNSKSCKSAQLQELELHPANTILQLPAYRIVDSVRYDPATLLNYEIQSLDSSVSITAFVKSIENVSHPIFDLEPQIKFQKQEVEFNRKSANLLTETISKIDTVRIGYVKYLIEQQSRKFYEARIVFYKEGRLVTLWVFEKYANDEQKTNSFSDCLLEMIKFK